MKKRYSKIVWTDCSEDAADMEADSGGGRREGSADIDGRIITLDESKFKNG